MTLTVGFLDAGRGDCTVIVYPDNTITLVDCGRKMNGDTTSAPIAQALQPFLNNNNNTINTLVLTHADADHYNLVQPWLLGAGAPTVNQVYYGSDLSLYAVAVQQFIKARSPVSPGNGSQYFTPVAGTSPTPDPNLSRTAAGVRVYILACNAFGFPTWDNAAYQDGNSLCLVICYQGVKIFLMGDATAATEAAIVQYCNTAGLTSSLLTRGFRNVLKLGSHGSILSSSSLWLQTLTPDTVFVSSDTSFPPRGQGTPSPSKTLLDQIQAPNTLGQTAPLHQWVQFNAGAGPATFELAPAAQTQLELCSTLYDFQPLTPTTFQATGGTWCYAIPGGTTDPQITLSPAG